MTISQESLAAAIEHTLLRPEATTDEIDRLCDEAVRFGFAGVCVNPVHVVRAAARWSSAAALGGDRAKPAIVTVAGFPLGANRPETKVEEARRAMDDGATDVDLVIQLGALIAGDRVAVRQEIESVARVVHGSGRDGVLKVILETGSLTSEQIILGCRCAAEGEADFVKTSTGFHPKGGATIEHVRLLHRYASPMPVKASGGIRTAAQARALMQAGAVRIGTSSGVAMMRELT